MATGLVITVAEKLFAVLHSQELAEICSMFGYESQLDDLKTTVFTIKSVLLDAESKHQELTHAGRDYIERLKDAVYDVDDLLDEFNTMVQKEKYKKGGKVSKKVRQFFSRTNQFLVAYNMSHEIKNLRGKLDKIAKDRQQFGLSDVYVPLQRREETMSFASEDYVVGRETDKDTIVGMLLGDSKSSNNVDYVTIVGIGGLGKTALAQIVYNDDRIEKAFKLRMWVCVSDDFVLEKIFQKMVGKDGSTMEGLQRKLRKLLQGKKYLLVLDDVWNESRDKWDNLKLFLNLGGTGSRVLVTSRSKTVARVVGDNLMYELKGLSDDNSWNLFKRLAFKHGEEPTNSDSRFFDIGKEIVKKCANVPLSIRVVGSMLYDQNESKWLSLKSANMMEIGQGDDGVMSILKYSYYHLTPALKSCFSYCALFPKDFEISKWLLVILWMAHGCLENSYDCQSEEDVGEEYFAILLHRCFFQDIERDMDGEIESFKMHDLIHDLALEVAGKETIMFDSVKCELNQRISHVSFTRNGCSLLANPIAQLSEMKTSRTFLIVSGMWSYNLDKSNLTAILSHLRRLRVLDLHSCGLETLPDTVGNLLHLRYLDLSENNSLKVLPNSITKLINLLVLNLGDTDVRELPHDMKKLVNLRQLILWYCSNLSHMPPGLDTLTSLHILPSFVAGDETSSHGKIAKLKDLRALVNLRHKLTIKLLDNFSCDVADYKEVELLRLAPLNHLTIRFRHKDAANHETLLGCFQPHCRLSTISIKGYKGLKFPLWAESITTSLPHLVRIHLKNIDCLEMLPSLSQLQHLKYLNLEGISNVEFMEESDEVIVPLNDQLSFFPSLEELELHDLPKLKGWWRKETNTLAGEGCASSLVVPSFPRLCKLVLLHCPNLTTFPSCPKLLTMTLWKCHEALTLIGSNTTIFRNLTTSSVLYLEELTLHNTVGALDSLFGESLGGIEKLTVRGFEGEILPKLAVVRPNIRRLDIQFCHSLKSLLGFVEHLSGLQSLTIEHCGNLEFVGVTVTPWSSLHLLSSLTLHGLPKLINLPEAFQDFTSLEHLSIFSCENLEALPEWLNCLTSLQTLSITGCRKLKSLPEAIAHMPSLKTLDLLHSEDLSERCSKPDGKDWAKISRIPRILLYKKTSLAS